ncbi:hypothetical protein L7F22_027213 [Adiantum nelumboides]|nr:hypothetical protein [Adiantum nelumboides]
MSSHADNGGISPNSEGGHKKSEELTIDIPTANSGTQSATLLQQRKKSNANSKNAGSQTLPRSRPSQSSVDKRQSFHGRDSLQQHRPEYHDPKSPYINPNHYSARPDTYHRKSMSSIHSHHSNAPSTPTMSGTNGSTATQTGGAGFHDSFDSGDEDASGHHRGPTAFADQGIDYHTSHSRVHTKEEMRLEEDLNKQRYWRRWGCYVSERQWATVREDYSENGDPWTHFNHETARSRTFRWGEDGIAGVSDNHCRLAFSLAFWNGKDRMLKERMFGLANNQGNHGEDVKELYWYLDNTPTHSYMKMLYKYPQQSYPYEQLVRESQMRSRDVAEFEITDTDLFDENKYWDIFIEYAKDSDNENSVSCRISAYNRGPEEADLHIIPQMFFRNSWSWPKAEPPKPKMKQVDDMTVEAEHPELGTYYLYCPSSPAPSAPPRKRGAAPELISDEEILPKLMFTENETNFERLYNGRNKSYAKDAFHDHIIPHHRLEKDQPEPIRKTRSVTKTRKVVKPIKKVVKKSSLPNRKAPGSLPNGIAQENNEASLQNGDAEAESDGEDVEIDDTEEITEEYEEDEVYFDPPTDTSPRRQYINPNNEGTKMGAHYVFEKVPANGGCAVVRIKLTTNEASEDVTVNDDEQFDALVESRRFEADEFYHRIAQGHLPDDMRSIMRQGYAGMLWNKQFYCFIQPEWISGDEGQPPPPPSRKHVRNKDWRHLHMEDILSMPDKWEYPFPCVWDTAFHCIPLAVVDPTYAKKQLDLFTREWYMKPDGALPAYEWNFGDVNPPVHAWATFRTFKIERKVYGREDLDFLERVFQKLLINFTWWVNRKDSEGSNVFEGGFLGLDNIGPFNRSEPLPTGGVLRQADGTSWMSFYALQMLNMALELAKHNPTYEDIASKFFEHFIFIADAMTYKNADEESFSLWSEEEKFYFDAIVLGPGKSDLINVKSLVGLIALYPTLTLEPNVFKKFPSFGKRVKWFLDNRPEISKRNIQITGGRQNRRLLSMVDADRLRSILTRMLNETEFLSTYGIRSLSKEHQDKPWSINVNGEQFSVGYWPGDSRSPMFGGNSNWRGPIWIAVNFLLIESLQRFYQFYGNSFTIECPTGSGNMMHLAQVAEEISARLISIFEMDPVQQRRPCNAGIPILDHDPNFRDLVPFHEFFHGESGAGLGASHQCGWTGLISYLICTTGFNVKTPRTPRSMAAHYFDEHMTDDGKSEAGSTTTFSAVYSRPPSPDEL